MNIQINNLSNKTTTTWQSFLKNHPYNTVFQSPEMYFFYQKVHNFEPFLFYIESEKGDCLGIMIAVLLKEGRGIKGYFSSRVVVYGGPLIKEKIGNSNDVLNAMLSALVKRLMNRSVFIQFRNFFEWTSSEKSIFLKKGFHYNDRLNLLVTTTSKEEVLANFSTSRRRQIIKALKSGVCIVDAESENDIKDFYNILKKLYTKKVKKPLPEWSFFKEFYNHSKQGQLGMIKLIKINSTIIGGILSPVTKGKSVYEWYVAGLDKDYKHLYPSVLATWAPIDYALNNHLAFFDFMGLGKPNADYGVRDFKMKFGKEVVNYGRFGRHNKILYPFVEFAYNVLRMFHKV